MADNLDGLVQSVLRLDLGLDAMAIAEAIWLATATPVDSVTGHVVGLRKVARHTDSTSRAADGPQQPEPTQTDIQGPPMPAPPDTAASGVLRSAATDGQVLVRQSEALPNALALANALRPFKRRWSQGRQSELDLEATVRSFTLTRRLIPEFRPSPERWFDLLLVIDDSPGMALWNHAVTELTRVLQQVGAFRRIQQCRMTPTGDRSVLRNQQGDAVGPDQFKAPNRRTLVIVVTDGSDIGWRRSEVWRMLRAWATSSPTALLTPLPARLWSRSGLDLPAVRVGASAPGALNVELSHTVPHLLGLDPL
ncbi:SAV_2336 family protein [Streptomyces sp. NBC_01007]|nr:SAV_2336 family protein [Streptomyces sp. NBC_01007]